MSVERGIEEVAASEVCRCKDSVPKDEKGGKSNSEEW